MAHAGARAGMHQQGESKVMTSPRQSIVQPQPTTVNALLRRMCCAWRCVVPVQHAGAPEQAQQNLSQENIYVTSNSPLEDILLVTLIRTDTTLDHRQKAEKMWRFIVLRLVMYINV